MGDPSHHSSTRYKVDKEAYDRGWERAFGKKEDDNHYDQENKENSEETSGRTTDEL